MKSRSTNLNGLGPTCQMRKIPTDFYLICLFVNDVGGSKSPSVVAEFGTAGSRGHCLVSGTPDCAGLAHPCQMHKIPTDFLLTHPSHQIQLKARLHLVMPKVRRKSGPPRALLSTLHFETLPYTRRADSLALRICARFSTVLCSPAATRASIQRACRKREHYGNSTRE
jgi:hypothetical protein